MHIILQSLTMDIQQFVYNGVTRFLANSMFMLATLMVALVIASGIRWGVGKFPPGPRGIPILGYLPFLTNLPHQKLAALARRYGQLMYMHLGTTPFLVVSSPEMIREVMVTQDHVFASRPQRIMVNRVFMKLRLSGLGITPLGPDFDALRRLYTHHVQSPRMVAAFEHVRRGEVHDMVRSVEEDAQAGRSVDLNRKILVMTTNITTLTVIRKRYLGKNAENHKGRTLGKVVSELFDYIVAFQVGDFIPFLQPLEALWSNTEQKLTDLATEADSIVQNLIQQHTDQQLHRERSSTNHHQVSVIDELLQYRGKDGQPLDNQIIKTVVLEYLVAADDGPWVATEWAFAELLRHPKVMAKLQEELDGVVGTARAVSESDLPNLPYLHAVVNETFRLHPSGPLLVPHENTHDTEIAGYHIPAHTRVIFNTWAMARDEAVWERPGEFDPRRFLGLTEGQQLEHKTKLVPWGVGRRACVGMRTGSLVTHLAVAHLVHCFNWSSTSAEALDMTETSLGLKVPMKFPLSRLRATPRLDVDAVYGQRDELPASV